MYNYTKTFVFKELIADFDSFTELRDKYIVGELEATEEQQHEVFNILFTQYCNSSVAFDMADAFYRHFYLQLWNVCDLFVNKLSLVKRLRSLPLTELQQEMSSISNIASNDNSIVNNPLSEIIPYITTQSTSATKSNTALAINRALTLYRDNEVDNFINSFKRLFLTIHGDRGIMYRRE